MKKQPKIKLEPRFSLNIELSKDFAEGLAQCLQLLFEHEDFQVASSDLPELHQLYQQIGNQDAIDDMFM